MKLYPDKIFSPALTSSRKNPFLNLVPLASFTEIHIVQIAGVDHVGLGSDFDGVSGATPQGMDSAADLPKITQARSTADTLRKKYEKSWEAICCEYLARSSGSAMKRRRIELLPNLSKFCLSCRTIHIR
jgi:Membrane dipeptidase (Peptidase family M19)